MIRIIKATDSSMTVNFTKDSAVFDITGYTLFFTVKKPADAEKGSDDDAIIKKTVTTHTDPTAGISTITLSNSDTNIDAGNYLWDIKLLKETIVSATYSDYLEIVQNITVRKA